jgi:two-component system, NarL family, response regulator DevR
MGNVYILIVDDDAIIRRLIRRMVALAYPAVGIQEAATVAQARHLLEAAQPQVVITDFELPDGTGLDVLARARALQPTLPVYMMSGDTQAAALAAEAGAAAFLPKPLDLPLLLQVLRPWFAAGDD